MRPLSRYAQEGILICPGGGIDFPHGNHGGVIVLEYGLDESGLVRFEQWWSDGPLNPAPVLKQSEPGYTWTERQPGNWFGTAANKQALHVCYQHARTHVPIPDCTSLL
jgi:hypothetical protein